LTGDSTSIPGRIISGLEDVGVYQGQTTGELSSLEKAGLGEAGVTCDKQYSIESM
jgi:hypothetical protein